MRTGKSHSVFKNKGLRVLLMAVTILFSSGLQAEETNQTWDVHREDIRMVQKYLKKNGFDPGHADGLLGPRTRDAIIAYQTEKGLAPTGRITENLIAQLLAHITVPEGFFVSYSCGPAHADWGGKVRVTVKPDGEYSVTRTRRLTRSGPTGPDQGLETLDKGRLSPARMKLLYTQAMSCGIFKMKRNYRNPEIIDGFEKHVDITANGRSHSVSCSNTSVFGMSCISDILKASIPAARSRPRR